MKTTCMIALALLIDGTLGIANTSTPFLRIGNSESELESRTRTSLEIAIGIIEDNGEEKSAVSFCELVTNYLMSDESEVRETAVDFLWNNYRWLEPQSCSSQLMSLRDQPACPAESARLTLFQLKMATRAERAEAYNPTLTLAVTFCPFWGRAGCLFSITYGQKA